MIAVPATERKNYDGMTIISYNTSSSTMSYDTAPCEVTVTYVTTVDYIAIEPPAEEPQDNEEPRKVEVEKPCLDNTATARKQEPAPGLEKMGVWPRWQRPPPAGLFCLFQETSLRKEAR